MPSITYWNRVEPRSRSRSLTRSLSAQVRDALWFLTRQWQFGEFQGEDAASPAYVQFASSCSRIQSWQIPGEAPRPLGSPPSAPLETLVEREPFTPDLATAVELGQRFEAFLVDAGLAGTALQAVTTDFRAAYPVPLPTDPASGAVHDPALARFLRVCAGRAMHGVRLYQAYQATQPALPPAPAVDPARQAAVHAALERLVQWVQAVYGELGTTDPPAWRPERLEYNAQIAAITPAGSAVTLTASPGRFGEFDWYSFDQLGPGERAGRPEPETTTRSLLPIHVRFRGMPNTRWWHFERGSMNLADVRADRSELGKLVLIDFMLIHGNDWFVVPFTQEIGTLCRVDAVLVHDVFGDTTLIPPANARTGAPTERWSLFTVTVQGAATTADYFVLPPSAPSATLGGEQLEEARFLRDEMFNSAWALEHTIENGLAQPWSGHERAQEIAPLHEPLVNDTDSPLKYLDPDRCAPELDPLPPRRPARRPRDPLSACGYAPAERSRRPREGGAGRPPPAAPARRGARRVQDPRGRDSPNQRPRRAARAPHPLDRRLHLPLGGPRQNRRRRRRKRRSAVRSGHSTRVGAVSRLDVTAASAPAPRSPPTGSASRPGRARPPSVSAGCNSRRRAKTGPGSSKRSLMRSPRVASASMSWNRHARAHPGPAR